MCRDVDKRCWAETLWTEGPVLALYCFMFFVNAVLDLLWHGPVPY